MCAGGVVFLGSTYLGPCSKSPYMRVCICAYYVRVFCPSTTSRAAVSASSLWATPVCDLTLPMCVMYPMLSLVRMILSASCSSYLWGWWLKLRGSMAYLRMVLMLKALFVNIDRLWSCLLPLRARVMAASSALLMVGLSGCDFFQYVWWFGYSG